MIDIVLYKTATGKEPFLDWLKTIDNSFRKRIVKRLNQIIETGNFGDHKSLGEGIFELRFDFGSGYRIYFGFEQHQIIILFCGGDKKTQTKDIKKAQEYWEDYNEKEY
ncbi:MAG: type II toxin-antitoxin system RelE/ParE family toxin [Pseudomonadota bacterium]